MIDSISTTFEQFIVDQIKQAKYFSILADETMDNSRTPQLSLCLRYVHENEICERFVCFAELEDFSGQGIAKQILSILAEIGLDIDCMVGQGYDGAAAMSGIKNGVQKHVRDVCSIAVYTHCAAHSLNLCFLKAADISEIQKAVTLMNDIAVFFKDSSKRQKVLETSIDQKCPESRCSRLKLHCKTRWVERQEAVRVFSELLPAIQDALEKISLWPAGGLNSAGKAMVFMSALNGVFFAALEILVAVLEITKPLSTKLQGSSQDLHHMLEEVNDCITVLGNMRANAKEYENILAKASSGQSDIEIPRIVARQQHRSNPPSSTPMEYFKLAVYFPFIDIILEQLNERFSSHNANSSALSALLPAYCQGTECESSRVKSSANCFEKFFTHGLNGLDAEISRWKSYWSRQASTDRPKRVMETISRAEELGTYPVISKLLRIFATIPVTTATNERSFSSLKLVKTYLRSTMAEDRLTGLAHLYINKDIKLDYEKVINEFGRKNRRFDFV